MRVLEDRLHASPQRPQLPLAEPGDVPSLELDRSRRRHDEPQHRPAERGLPAPALPDEPQRLPGEHLDGDAVDGPHHGFASSRCPAGSESAHTDRGTRTSSVTGGTPRAAVRRGEATPVGLPGLIRVGRVGAGIQVTGGGVVVADLSPGGDDLVADGHGQRAAGREGAAGKGAGEVGRRAGDRGRGLCLQGDDRTEQRLRVGVTGSGEHRRHRPFLDDAAGVHDGHPVAGLGHDPEVVGDEDHGEAEAAPQLARSGRGSAPPRGRRGWSSARRR